MLVWRAKSHRLESSSTSHITCVITRSKPKGFSNRAGGGCWHGWSSLVRFPRWADSLHLAALHTSNYEFIGEDVQLSCLSTRQRVWPGKSAHHKVSPCLAKTCRSSVVERTADTDNWRLLLPFSCLAAPPTTDSSQSGAGLAFSRPIRVRVNILTVGLHVRSDSLGPERPINSRWRQHVPMFHSLSL